MGLDMYLTKRTYVKNWDHNPPERKTEVTVLLAGKPHPGIVPSRVSYIIEEVAYWRKANAIHGWFVTEVQEGRDECQESYVQTEQLQTLVESCEKVLKAKTKSARQALAAELKLEPTPGFFFGGTEMDQYYVEDLKETVRQLKPLLVENQTSSDGYYYRASW